MSENQTIRPEYGDGTSLGALVRQVAVEARARLGLTPSDSITLTRRARNLAKRGDFLLFVPSLLRGFKPILRRSGVREASSEEEDVTPDLALTSPDFKGSFPGLERSSSDDARRWSIPGLEPSDPNLRGVRGQGSSGSELDLDGCIPGLERSTSDCSGKDVSVDHSDSADGSAAIIETLLRLKPGQFLLRLRRAPVYDLVLRAVSTQGEQYGRSSPLAAQEQPAQAAILDWDLSDDREDKKKERKEEGKRGNGTSKRGENVMEHRRNGGRVTKSQTDCKKRKEEDKDRSIEGETSGVSVGVAGDETQRGMDGGVKELTLTRLRLLMTAQHATALLRANGYMVLQTGSPSLDNIMDCLAQQNLAVQTSAAELSGTPYIPSTSDEPKFSTSLGKPAESENALDGIPFPDKDLALFQSATSASSLSSGDDFSDWKKFTGGDQRFSGRNILFDELLKAAQDCSYLESIDIRDEGNSCLIEKKKYDGMTKVDSENTVEGNGERRRDEEKEKEGEKVERVVRLNLGRFVEDQRGEGGGSKQGKMNVEFATLTADGPAFVRIHRMETVARLLRSSTASMIKPFLSPPSTLSVERDATLTDLARAESQPCPTGSDELDKSPTEAGNLKLDGFQAEAVMVVQVLSHREEFLGRQVELMWNILVPGVCKLKQPLCAFGFEVAMMLKCSAQLRVVCAEVKGRSGSKPLKSAADFFRLRHRQIRAAFLSKYGDTVSGSLWEQTMCDLVKAVVKFELLSTVSKQEVKLDLSEIAAGYGVEGREISKGHARGQGLGGGGGGAGGVFVMYNVARLATLFRNFEESVSQGLYPALPEMDSIQVSALRDEEEWELVFSFLLPYSDLIRETTPPLPPPGPTHSLGASPGDQGRQDTRPCSDTSQRTSTIHTHRVCQMLVDLSNRLSAYYCKTHVLAESRAHLMPTMHARLLLLRCVQQLLHNALHLLDIAPLAQL